MGTSEEVVCSSFGVQMGPLDSQNREPCAFPALCSHTPDQPRREVLDFCSDFGTEAGRPWHLDQMKRLSPKGSSRPGGVARPGGCPRSLILHRGRCHTAESPSSEPSSLPKRLWPDWGLASSVAFGESILKPTKVFQCGKWPPMPATPPRACEQQLPGWTDLGPVRGSA